jgi:uncharacterized protein DUF3300
MKITTKTLRRAVGGAALATILATMASAQSPSWPTPPAPAPQAESPTAPEAGSPTAPQSKPASQLSPARLGQMLAPIALYPDDLLADILVAATYPLDVVEAARWVQDPQNTALKGDQLFAALQQKPWDPNVKSLTPFPDVLRMLDANLEWTEQLGEAYLADPAAVMDGVQGLRRRAQLARRLVMTPQEIVGAEQNPTSSEEPITIEPSSPEIVYVPVCDPSFSYGPWPYPDYPPFFPVFVGATIGGCSWINGPIVGPFWGLAILNFRTRHIEIDRKRLALFDRDRDRERDRDHALGEEWRHDPGHRGNVPYRNPAVSALFGRGTPAANARPGFGGRWTGLPPVVAPRAVALPQAWRPPGIEGARPPLDGGRRRAEEIRIPREEGRSSTAGPQPALEGVDPTGRGARVGQPAGAQPRFEGAQSPLEGVDPTESRARVGQSLDRDAETRMLLERGELFGRVPPTALAPRLGGLRGSGSFGGARSIQSVGGRGSFRPLLGVGAQPFGARGPGAIGVQPFSGRGPQMPAGGIGAGGGRGGG